MSHAIVLLSGGLDSAICLLLAHLRKQRPFALGFNYGQTSPELGAAQQIATLLRTPFDVLDLSALAKSTPPPLRTGRGRMWATADARKRPHTDTFVPGRNLLFLAHAAAFGFSRHAYHLILGIGQRDSPFFPDTQEPFRRSAEHTLRQALGKPIRIEAPLMGKTKGEGIKLGLRHPRFLEIAALTISCYRGAVPGCQNCPACTLRTKGFAEAGIPDPAYPRFPHA